MGLTLTTSRHETGSSNSVREYPIPDDLLVEIFSRVPLKSLARFGCVSKIWASIFRRSDFTDLFLTKSLTRPRLLFTVKANGNKLLFYSLPQPHNPDHNSSLVVTPYHLTLDPGYRPSFISKPVCGLVLLLGWGTREVPLICNPAKGKVQPLSNVAREENYTPRGIYLGYDPIGKQFKVLCLTLTKSLYSITHWILILESGKPLWRKLESELIFEATSYHICGDICINGVLYFEGTLEGSFVIVYFDFRSEKFVFINRDKGMLKPRPFGFSGRFFNYNGKLGIHRRVEENLFLWVLEDAGNHKWSKNSYVLSPFEEIILRWKQVCWNDLYR